MVKQSTIDKLLYDKVANELKTVLETKGFKYLKSKKQFARQQGIFSQVLNLSHPYSPLCYDEQTERVFLTFTLSPSIQIPKFDAWYLEKTGQNLHFDHRDKPITSRMELSFDDFSEESFYTPSAAQNFKSFVTLSLMVNDPKETVIPIQDVLGQSLEAIVSELEERSDILRLFKKREYAHDRKLVLLLVFGGYSELANEHLDKSYKAHIDHLASGLKADDAKLYIRHLDEFIKMAQQVAQRTYTNPYKRSVTVAPPQQEAFDFSPTTRFTERLRLDISGFDLLSFQVNSIGETLFLDNNRIVKLNPEGEVVLEKEIAPPKGFDKFWYVRTGWIGETDDFFVNNYIVRKDNSLLKLPLPLKKSKKLQNPHIVHLAYLPGEKKYGVLYEGQFLVYSKEGQLEKSLSLPTSYHSRIIVEKGWIASTTKDNTLVLQDFEGQTLASYEYAHGNDHYQFSSSFEYLVCSFYSTKSQFYYLRHGKKDTLWAHPTYIKEYKETLYNNVSHNFGMTAAKFAPDSTYLVGGADHGKYVAWTLPKLERVELIPQQGLLEQFPPGDTGFFVLEGQTFWKNRGNDISNIMFLQNGGLFLTQLGGNYLLSWDKSFKNLAYYKTNGRFDLHADRYLTQKTKTEVVLYTQE